MLSGYYTIASGMMTNQRQLDVIGNNLVNAQTPGYRADRLVVSSFEQELLTRREGSGDLTLGRGVAATSAVVGEVVPLFNSGMVQSTDRALDVAIDGDGFFNIQGTDGTTYLTRNGQFDIDQNGYLILPGVGRVLGQGGPLQVGENFTLQENGELYNSEGTQIGALRLSAAPENTPMIKLENGLFRLPDGAQAQNVNGSRLLQKQVERSNVDMNLEMTKLIEAQRAFQACSSALQVMDGINRKAASQLAALNG